MNSDYEEFDSVLLCLIAGGTNTRSMLAMALSCDANSYCDVIAKIGRRLQSLRLSRKIKVNLSTKRWDIVE